MLGIPSCWKNIAARELDARCGEGGSGTMIVTMAMVFDGLARRFECVKGAHFKPGHPVVGARAVSDRLSTGDGDGICYVSCDQVDSSRFGIKHESVVHGRLAGAGEVPCAIAVSGVSGQAELCNEVARVINAYTIWANDLLELDVHGAGLEEMVDYAHGLFGNPMTIIDHNYRVIAYSKTDCMDDCLWVAATGGENALDSSRAPATCIEEAGFLKYLDELKEHGELHHFKTAIDTEVTACLARDGDNGLVAVNVVGKNRPVTEGDLDCLKHFGKIVGSKMRAIEFTWQDSSNCYDALLHDVVRGNLVNANDFRTRLGEKWINVLPNFTVLVIASHTGLLKYHQLCQVEDDLIGILPDARCVIHARTLVCFINHAGSLDRCEWGAFKAYLEQGGLVVGVSESRGDDCSLHDLVRQAQIALRVGRRQYPERTVVDYDDCRQYYLFDLCIRCGDWRRYLHPCLKLLERHDEDSNAPLLPTLECLVRNFGNKTIAAKSLDIKRNTLQYRLEKIEQLCRIDLSDEAVFDHIATSFALRDFARQVER